ncbi:MAG: 5-oxoprolinase [Myxococcales bacterium]|nr:5-oxoprolinase [Myxococcales bacterium]
MSRPHTYVDRGGTFTDFVHVDDAGTVTMRKVPSDDAVVGALAAGPITFGTTVATNALLERRVVRVLLVVTEGFADLVRIGDMARRGLFLPDDRWPPPLATRVVEARGRHGPDGGEVDALEAPVLDLRDIDAVAIVCFGSCWNPSHELALAALLPVGTEISLGHRLSPEVGYLARVETALLDAAVSPVLHRALRSDRIPHTALAIRSDGTLTAAQALRAPDAVLSGPAGGALAVEAVAVLAGLSLAVGLDMGGTSTDVCVVEPGRLTRRQPGWRVAGLRVGRPALEIETVAAGGGSILGRDALGYTVGPESAGADPGPQALGRGGPPTLTDAAIDAGLVDVANFPLDLHLEAIRLPGPADAFLAIAREAMADAIRRLALRRGLDVRRAALVAFGGAAGQHACVVAEKLGIDEVLVHACAPVLSAWGQALARASEEAVTPIWAPLPAGWPAVQAAWASMAAALPALGELQCQLDIRVRGTDAVLAVEAQSPDAAAAAFEIEHRRRFGFVRHDRSLDVVNARCRSVAPRPEPLPAPVWPEATPRQLDGPARLDLPGTSVWVADGWRAERQGVLFRLRRLVGSRSSGMEDPASLLPLWGARLMSAAEEAGEVLRRLARSVNIRERLDFSCALFDGNGTLVANAPHVPVHLGAMGETVRDIVSAVAEPADGDAWLTNDPQAGGSHLPDLTVVRCVILDGVRFFVGNRAHHVDVGGVSPGSMPPHSTCLADEGLVFRRFPLRSAGRVALPELEGCRDPGTVAADLEAQLASADHCAGALRALGTGPELDRWMQRLVDAVAAAASRVLPSLAGEAEEELDGVRLHVRIAGGTFDFRESGDAHPGNLNAPRAVVRAVVVYVIRVLMGVELPLNEGILRATHILTRPGSLLDPPPAAAVVGGNVETSQRLVDLCFAALGVRAASQGTMNNLTLGGKDWAFYETIGGGLGSTPDCAGQSGAQVHMTNTRATDPEILEARLPLRVRRFSLRAASGGRGVHVGGDGLVRELELREHATASLLAAWRPGGAQGLAGGGHGAPGRATLIREGVVSPWDGQPAALNPGDRVRLETPGGGGFGADPDR